MYHAFLFAMFHKCNIVCVNVKFCLIRNLPCNLIFLGVTHQYISVTALWMTCARCAVLVTPASPWNGWHQQLGCLHPLHTLVIQMPLRWQLSDETTAICSGAWRMLKHIPSSGRRKSSVRLDWFSYFFVSHHSTTKGNSGLLPSPKQCTCW